MTRKYPDGKVIPKELPEKYAKAKTSKNCGNCVYFQGRDYCTLWGAKVRSEYFCAKWKSKKDPAKSVSTVKSSTRSTTRSSGSSGY